MAGNAIPQFTKQANASVPARVSAGNVKSDGSSTAIGTDIFLALTADATNGTYVGFVRWMPTASAAGTNTTATVGRIFLSSVTAGATTSANTFLIDEVVLPLISAANSAAAVNTIDRPIDFRIPAGWTLLVTNHVTPAASTSWVAVALSTGDY